MDKNSKINHIDNAFWSLTFSEKTVTVKNKEIGWIIYSITIKQ